jgi:hypothetical protein
VASAVTERKVTSKEAGKRRHKENKLVDVDASKSSKKGRGKKPDNDVAGKETLSVEDTVKVLDKKVILVFPFVTGSVIETATRPLKLCHSFRDWMDEAYESLADDDIVQLQHSASFGRNQIVSITQYDLKTVEPGNYVNDNIVDFGCAGSKGRKYPTRQLCISLRLTFTPN